MIRYFFFILTVCVAGNTYTQNRFTIAPNIGYYLYHSDNHLPVTRNENLIVSYGIGAGYEFSINPKHRALVELTYYRTDLPKAYSSYMYAQPGSELGDATIRMLYQFVSFDASMIKTLNNGLTFGAGPSLTNCNRTTFSPRAFGVKAWPKDDAFNVWGAGLQGFVRASLNANQSIFGTCRLRMNAALIKFGNGRDLSDYRADFIHVQFSLGYAFGKKTQLTKGFGGDIRIKQETRENG